MAKPKEPECFEQTLPLLLLGRVSVVFDRSRRHTSVLQSYGLVRFAEGQ